MSRLEKAPKPRAPDGPPKRPLAERIGYLLFLVGLLIPVGGGLLGAVAGYSLYVIGCESVDWPAAEATITEVYVGQSTHSTSNNSTLPRASGSRTRTSYTVNVRYEYRVNGKTHRGEREPDSSSSRASAEELAEDYRPGDSFGSIYYDPANPSLHVDERGRVWPAWLIMAAMPLFFGLGIGMLSHQRNNSEGPFRRPFLLAAAGLYALEAVGVVAYHLQA